MAIITEKNKNEFTIDEVLDYMQENKTRYKETTIRTHIAFKCCKNSLDNHGTTYEDFERVGRGLYKLL
ncbi:DUF7669 domain-containing protein [Oceanirhabdus seepicola]|uniref:DUF7669 domain-containing protein n=1 Tax=Oceanirhabdus seepicola TaxID=2828781 RepID=A0A9J6P9R4_9CLOT|nr:hypothetical protein [Oceanirhabdus seepicola]MCM1992537.1 hypothetical protein [Oceanirhabdus seepicola]